jgi:hypothetical protein
MVMQEHLQNLMSQGSMTVAELAACHVPEDSAPPFHSGWGICRGMRGIQRARIWCSSTLISLLFAIVLRLRTVSLDPLRDLTHGGLCDLM